MQTVMEMMDAIAVTGIAVLLLLGIGVAGLILVKGRHKTPEERKLEDDEQEAYLKESAAKAKKK